MADYIQIKNGSANTYPTSSVSLGTYVDVKSYTSTNKYTAPCDGYFLFASSTTYRYRIGGLYVGGASNNVNHYETVFVKKGLQLFAENTLNSSDIARFYPLVLN